jgi:kynurenine formamidase
MTGELLASMLVTGYEVHDLSRPLRVGMPQSPNHPEFRHVLVRRHGDTHREDGGSAANDLIVTGTHVGTHVDALGHVSHAGKLFGGVDADEAQRGGRFEGHGIDAFGPFVGRGVLLDVASALGWEQSPAGQEITVEDLERTAAQQGTELRQGDAVLVRSGWARYWDDRALYQGESSGVPGPGEAGATWLADHGAAVVGADTIAFEHLPPGQGHSRLPAHRVLLVERGINIIETLDLEGVAAAGLHEFMFVLNPLNIVGATGAPVRPLAVVPVT